MIHPLADVQAERVDSETSIWQFCVVLPHAVIGCDCNIGSHCFIENRVIIGDRVTVKCGVQLWDGIVIEDDVFIGPNVTFCNDRYPKSKNKDFILEPILLKKGCAIGANSTILPGITVGSNSIVGAGSLVTKNIADNMILHSVVTTHSYERKKL